MPVPGRRTPAGLHKSVLRALFVFLAVCPPAADAQVRFIERGQSAGIHTPFRAQGVAVADYDGDGRDDILFAGWDSVALFRNNGDLTFTNTTAVAGLSASGRYVMPLWADWDNDGDPDLYLGQADGVGTSRIFRNNGGTFTDVTSQAGIDIAVSVGTAAAGDYDNDGRVDLYVATRGAFDQLYRNVSGPGGIAFQNVSELSGMKGKLTSIAMQVTWVDADQDGDVDVYAVHDGFDLSRFHVNGGALPFPNLAGPMKLDSVGAGNSMGVAWGDIDRDGLQDVYVTRISYGGLYRNRGAMPFEDVSASSGADTNGMSWGAVFGDFDNDGWEDLAIVNISSFGGLRPPSILFRNNRDGTFTDVAAEAGFRLHSDLYGLASGDFNNDGRMDLVGATYLTPGTNRLWINTSPDTLHWVKVRLEGSQRANRMGIGAVVRVRAGGATHVRSLLAGSSYCSQVSPVLHIGLGETAWIDTLEVLWAPGRRDVYAGLPADSLYTIREQFTTAVPSTSVGLPGDGLRIDGLYPNPFNATAHIAFHLSRDGWVRLSVYDVLGREVAVLRNGPERAGTGRAIVEAASLSSGAYVVRLSDGRRMVSARLLLLR